MLKGGKDVFPATELLFIPVVYFSNTRITLFFIIIVFSSNLFKLF